MPPIGSHQNLLHVSWASVSESSVHVCVPPIGSISLARSWAREKNVGESNRIGHCLVFGCMCAPHRNSYHSLDLSMWLVSSYLFVCFLPDPLAWPRALMRCVYLAHRIHPYPIKVHVTLSELRSNISLQHFIIHVLIAMLVTLPRFRSIVLESKIQNNKKIKHLSSDTNTVSQIASCSHIYAGVPSSAGFTGLPFSPTYKID